MDSSSRSLNHVASHNPNAPRPPDALPPPAVLCETRRLRALGEGVNGAVLIGDENRQLLTALDIPLTPVPSLYEDWKELCCSSSNCSMLDIAINDGCLATRECAKESAVLGAHDYGKCQLGYPKRVRDLSTDRVFELYVSQQLLIACSTVAHMGSGEEASRVHYSAMGGNCPRTLLRGCLSIDGYSSEPTGDRNVEYAVFSLDVPLFH